MEVACNSNTTWICHVQCRQDWGWTCPSWVQKRFLVAARLPSNFEDRSDFLGARSRSCDTNSENMIHVMVTQYNGMSCAHISDCNFRIFGATYNMHTNIQIHVYTYIHTYIYIYTYAKASKFQHLQALWVPIWGYNLLSIRPLVPWSSATWSYHWQHWLPVARLPLLHHCGIFFYWLFVIWFLATTPEFHRCKP